MLLFPESAAAQLGFDAVRQRLAHHALGAEAHERLARLGPFRSLDDAQTGLARVAELADALRFDDPVPFGPVLDLREPMRRIAPEDAVAPADDLVALRRVLASVRKLRAYFDGRTAKYPNLADVAAPLTPAPELERALDRVFGEDGQMRDDASPELARIRRQIVRVAQHLRDAVLDEMRRAVQNGYAADEQPTIRGGRFVLPIRAEAKRKIPGFVHDTSATGQTVYLEPASVLDLGNDVRELELAEHREVERILKDTTAAARAHLPTLRPSLRTLVALDLLQAKARLALDLDAQPFEMGGDGVIHLVKARHAALVLRFAAEQLPGTPPREVVPLSIALDDDARTLVITGPNAGGKSVAMKTVGLCALMAACGLLLPAAPGTRVDFFDRLYADIGDAQSLDDDLSTFSSHVARLRQVLKGAGPGTLVLLDEAGTGTDPAEGGALAQAVLERLTDAGARTIATTHIGALKAFAHDHPHVRNGAMRFDTDTLTPTYRFDPDVPGASYALEVAARGGLDARLLDRARDLAGTQSAALSDLILDFQTKAQTLDERLAEAAQQHKVAEAARHDFEQRRDQMRRQRDSLRAEALAEADRIVKEANAAVERTIREIKEAQAAPEATKAAREALADARQTIEHRKGKTDRRVKRSAPRAPSTPAALVPLSVGDQVMLDGGATPMEVLEIRGTKATVASGIVKMTVETSRLRRVGGRAVQAFEVRQTGGGLGALTAQTNLNVIGKRLDEALAALPRFLDAAAASGVESVEIVHGKGTGALRKGIRDWLTEQPYVVGFGDGPVDGGGAGITVVALR